jgi:hypothetical protein
MPSKSLQNLLYRGDQLHEQNIVQLAAVTGLECLEIETTGLCTFVWFQRTDGVMCAKFPNYFMLLCFKCLHKSSPKKRIIQRFQRIMDAIVCVVCIPQIPLQRVDCECSLKSSPQKCIHTLHATLLSQNRQLCTNAELYQLKTLRNLRSFTYRKSIPASVNIIFPGQTFQS